MDAAIAPQPGLPPDAAPCAAPPAPTSPTALQAIARTPVPDTDEAAAEPPATARRFDPPTGTPEPLRLSAHWTAQGVRIWLGADARALPSLPSVQAAIGPWLRLHGQQLLSLMCNGRPVRPAHAMHGAIPEFSSHPPLIPRETP
ncbi:hypothetical protein [Xylophilus rhododendri]|uniref:hypothetical protein n=1 Tax=Xylophilus rhododendri TaxID=2697032 RepID=UPI001E3AFDE8|nr:hypothetical protein [Xylophilus rhododendri]